MNEQGAGGGLSVSAQTLKSIGSVLELISENGGKLKVPADLFDNLPQTDEDSDASEPEQSSDGGSTNGIITPELLLKLPELLEAAAPVIKSITSRDKVGNGGISLERLVGNADDAARRVALLKAIRPYVSDHRAKAIDMLVGISRVGSIVASSRATAQKG